MQLTDEQKEIIASTGDIKINAVAGSGKTTTILEYARARPEHKRMLYLAFNKSVKLEAQRRFQAAGLRNVRVETAHSLAFHHVVRGNNFKLTPGYKTYQLAEMLDLQQMPDKHAAYIIANHVNKFAQYFCNSAARRVQELNYLDTITDSAAEAFVTHFYDRIEHLTRVFLAKMENREIDITHDFYLKKFQLAKPKLHYDYILFDEGQDASATMLDVFTKQKAEKVIVGDTHQQIYGWRYAVNSLEQVDYPAFQLSTSFRFDAEIALLANKILAWKRHFTDYKPIQINGAGHATATDSRATLARTNLSLLVKAIDLLVERREIESLYFEGNINSYTYADEGASLYDVLNLYQEKHDRIRDELLRNMRDTDELREYIEKTEDAELGTMLEIVSKYGRKLPALIKEVKERHLPDEERSNADMIFSTVHRCKGMEYDDVTLENDFIRESDILERVRDTREGKLDTQRLAEEVNLLYVAATRTKNRLHIPKALLPESRIKVIEPEREERTDGASIVSALRIADFDRRKNEFTPDSKPRKARAAGQPWTDAADRELTQLFFDGYTIKELAQHFDRTQGAIRARIKKLDIEF
jgi:superfamily I DNA/RNA helicase